MLSACSGDLMLVQSLISSVSHSSHQAGELFIERSDGSLVAATLFAASVARAYGVKVRTSRDVQESVLELISAHEARKISSLQTLEVLA